METIFNTPRGATFDPMTIELWQWNGTQAMARLETAEKITVTWVDGAPDTAEIIIPLDANTRALVPTDSETLVVCTLNGRRHVSTVVKSSLQPANDHDTAVNIHATTAGAWSLLQSEVITPSPGDELAHQASREEFTITAPVETVVKTIIFYGASSIGHPIKCAHDYGRGPQVTVSGRMKYAAELIQDALKGTGYRLALDAWLPGDNPSPEFHLDFPTVIADVVPYRDRPGLVLSRAAQDLEDWELTDSRAPHTRMIVGDSGKGTEQQFYRVFGDESVNPWARREGYLSTDVIDKSDVLAKGEIALQNDARTREFTASITPSALWEFGTDGLFPRQFDLGDKCLVDLGEAGYANQVITQVEAQLTPAAFTVTPKVGNPDTYESDIYSTVADLSKRVDRLGG